MLLERESELGVVAGALRRAGAGNGSLLVVTGPLGNGKTELMHGLAELAAPGVRGGQAPAKVLQASGAVLEQDFAFGVVRQLFEPALAAAPAHTRERWLDHAAGFARLAFADDSPPTEGRAPAAVAQAVLQGLQALAANMSADHPLLVLVDDLQWVDAPSLRWFGYLAKRLDRLPVTVVVSVREGDPRSEQPLISEITGSATRTLRPRPLSQGAITELVREQFGEAGDADFVAAVHDIAGGNPMFLMSILLNMVVGRRRPVASEIENARMLGPSMFRDRLVACLRSQPQPIRQFANAMALLGEHADLELIGRLARLDSVGCTEAVRVLDRLGLLAPGPMPRYIHLTVQDAVEESMTVEERARVHISAAKLLHGCGYPAEQVAAHLLAVTAPQDSWAIEVLRSAAHTALRRGAPEVAARYLRRALVDSSSDGEDRAMLLVDLATAERGFDPPASVRHISQAVPLLSTAKDRAAAVVRIAPSVLNAAPLPVGDLVRQVAAELGDPDTLAGPERELALRLEARLRYTGQEDPAQLAEAVDRLLAMGPDPGTSTGSERELLAVLLYAAMMSQKLPAAEIVQRANRVLEREPATASHVHTALPLLVSTLAAADSVKVVSSWLDIALEQAQRQKATVGSTWIYAEQALVLLCSGNVGKARARGIEALELVDAEWVEATTLASSALTTIAMDTNDAELARWLLDRNGERAGRTQYGVSHHAMHQLLTGLVRAADGEPHAALEYLLDAGQWLERAGWHNPAVYPWRGWAAAVQRQTGDLAAAAELIEEESARALAWGAPAAAGRALRAQASLHGGTRGVELLTDAVDLLRTSCDRLELAKALAQLGSRLQEHGDPTSADRLLRESRALAQACEAGPLVELAAPESPSAPVVVAGPQQAALTKTELRVAGMAAAGGTNQEIADELGVSLRAVEKHLTNSYRKLAVPGRAGLAAALSQHSA
ncbi:AAA family ATPase [Allokutzneria sp. NRRL B-24872]|uniref:ATP-binding protein n=1 Tax=Allokutzneria sp. NRRL B-24872 TaxID=1137961 RepID=UPI000A38C490|nr:LuxR family transcriptional regulator [Allokutzneria sp. NRRL B-24872]